MTTCSKCGSDNSDTAAVCKACGSLLQQSGAKTCPAGKHKMDATWTECPYCQQANLSSGPAPPARTPTMFEGQPAFPARGRGATELEGAGRPSPLPPRPRPVSPPPGPQGTVGEAKGPTSRKTEFRPVMAPGPSGNTPAPSISNGRKIVGMLVTYSWNPDGQVFPIYEGRNLIGRDKDCEVCIAEDQTLSGRNSHITYRQSFVIGDLVSMAGTDLDNVPIEEQFHSLPNYATIRAGSTYFTFIAVSRTAEAKTLATTPGQ